MVVVCIFSTMDTFEYFSGELQFYTIFVLINKFY